MPSISHPRTNTRAEEVARKLKGIERYNPNCRPMLEDYVQYQIENRFYDFDANMALLKMYQFDPSYFQADKVADILLLALTNLPKSDFLLCKYLLDTQKCQENSRIVEALQFAELLESCRFQDFWELLERTTVKIPGFEDRIREFICQTINRTYQTINQQELQSALGRLNNNDFEALIKTRGWKVLADDPNYIWIANHEENIKSRNIVEKIKFEHVAPVMNII
ncbi:unnamed protein product [Rotaria sp. Silwood1]|nr:unnamed protein product [Rotaria sp. Silwood1]CAF1193343.1 unnamed protein product [Rotaria sp. Silwood1]CAF1196911.1 unnamed protein product [Rotaria sp. Silwood1]CAF3455654.1 unnamed protein product [Rotaria sp. Silwood1]CAF3467480.1 unnamed protein product [Rotaria sp. Silwood1]